MAHAGLRSHHRRAPTTVSYAPGSASYSYGLKPHGAQPYVTCDNRRFSSAYARSAHAPLTLRSVAITERYGQIADPHCTTIGPTSTGIGWLATRRPGGQEAT